MKKSQRLLALLLALVLCLACLVACDDKKSSSDDDDDAKDNTTAATTENLIIGEWKTTLKMGPSMVDSLKQGMGADASKHFNNLKLDIVLNMEFTKDKKAIISIDDNKSNKDALNGFVDGFKDGIKGLLKEQLGAQLDQAIAAAGYASLDAYIDALCVQKGYNADSLAEKFFKSNEGTYTIDGKTLTVVPEDKPEKPNVYKISVTEDTLIFDMSDEDKADLADDPMMSLLPFVLTKK